MESQGSLNWRCLAWILLRYSNHRLHTLRRHQHFIETQKRVLKCPAKVLARLVLRLLLQLIWEEPFTKFRAFNAPMAVKHSEQTDAAIKLRCHNVCIFL